MAQDIQNFDLRLVKKETNSFYPNLINCVGIKSPYYNFGFRQKFVQSDTELGDNGEFFITKRKGFKKLQLYNYDGSNYIEETNDERINGCCYDVCIVGGYRYFLYFNKNETKLRIYKQIDVRKGDTENDTNEPISKGHIVNITQYNGNDYFPAHKTIAKKFLLTTYVKGKPKSEGIGTGIAVRDGDTYIHGLIPDGNISCSNGDYILTNQGLVHIVGKSDGIINKQAGVLLATSREKVMKLGADKNTIQNVEYKVFPDYGLTFHFATSDGLVHWHYDEGYAGSMEYTICGTTKQNTHNGTTQPRYYINAMSNYNQSVIFLNSKGALFLGGIGLDKFLFGGNIIQTTGVYTNLYEYMSNIILLGPNKIGYLIFDFFKNDGDIYELVSDGGTYSKYSVGIQDDKFLYIRDTKDFYQLQLSYGYGAVKPSLQLGYLSAFLNTDLEQLDKDINDVNVSINGNNTYIFINDGGDNTKVLYYDTYYALRFKRYVTGCKLKGYKHGVFYGGGIFSHEGNTDNGNQITQIISSMFGNRTQNVSKKIEYIKAAFGYNSYCTTDNSVFNAYVYDRGYEYTISYNINTRGGYLNNLFAISYDPDNFINKDILVQSKPIGIEIHSCKGVNTLKQNDTLTSEFEEYNNLGDFKQNISTGGQYCISKVGFMKFPIGQPANVISFELIARGDNKIEFGGFFVGFQSFDYDFTRIEDTARVEL